MKKFNPDFQPLINLGNAAAKAVETISECLAPCLKALSVIAEVLHKQMYQFYLDNGAVYGESPEGFARWLEDLARIKQAQSRIDRENDLREWEKLGKKIAKQIAENKNETT